MRMIGHLPLLTYPEAVSFSAIRSIVQMASVLRIDIDATVTSVDLPATGASIAGIVINVSDMIRSVENDSRNQAAALAVALQDITRETGCALRVETRTASPAEARNDAVDRSLYRDIALLPWHPDNLAARELAESVIFGSGRPALIVPSGHQPSGARHIAIAWDGSRVAARALADARHFLTDQAEVSVLTVHDEKRLDSDVGERLTESLVRRGLKARCHALSAKGVPMAHALQETSRDLGADLLVMGAYGHSRLRDFIVGGATQGVLAHLTIPVLMSH